MVEKHFLAPAQKCRNSKRTVFLLLFGSKLPSLPSWERPGSWTRVHMPPSTTRFRVRLPSLAGNLLRTGPCSLSLCPRNSEGMEIRNHNPEILSFTFLKIKGKIGRPKHVRLETQRDGETSGCGHEALGTSAYTETPPATRASQTPSKTDRHECREAGRRSFMSNSSRSVFRPKQLKRPPRFFSPHAIKCYRTSPWSPRRCLFVVRTSTYPPHGLLQEIEFSVHLTH